MSPAWLQPYIAGASTALAIVGGIVAFMTLGGSPAPATAGPDVELAEQFGVTVIWTEDIRNCGHRGGCVNPLAPDTIYVSPNLNIAEQRYVVLHELGHVLQLRRGQPMDECRADIFAEAVGTYRSEYCTINGSAAPVELQSPER